MTPAKLRLIMTAMASLRPMSGELTRDVLRRRALVASNEKPGDEGADRFCLSGTKRSHLVVVAVGRLSGDIGQRRPNLPELRSSSRSC
jgi:hypothetical protein